MKYKILDTDEIVTEKYLRKMLFEYETQDLLDNKKEYLIGDFNLDYQLECIKKAVYGDMKEIVSSLETLWNVPIEEITTEFITENIKQVKNIHITKDGELYINCLHTTPAELLKYINNLEKKE